MDINLTLNAILLIDNFTRLSSDINISELTTFGVDIVSDLKELLTKDYKNKPTVILEGFLRNPHGLYDLVLHQELLQIKFLFIGSDEIILKQVGRYAKTFALDTSIVNYNLVSAVINDDSEAQSVFKIDPFDRVAGLARAISDMNTVTPEMREVAQAYLRTADQYNLLSTDYNSLLDKVSMLEELTIIKDEQLKTLSDRMDSAFAQTVKINQSLRDYSFILSPNVYEKVDVRTFKNKPSILYFKEYGEFLHLKSFIFTLAESFKTQYSLPTKVLWIMDRATPLRVRFLPPYYKIFSTGVFTKPDVHISDYMCSTNGYAALLRVLCENQAGISILIIIDSKFVDDTVIDISDTLRYDLCRDHKKIGPLGLNPDRTIVNGLSEFLDLSWDYLPEYENLNPDDRFLYFAGRPVIETVIKTTLLEFGLQ